MKYNQSANMEDRINTYAVREQILTGILAAVRVEDGSASRRESTIARVATKASQSKLASSSGSVAI